MAKDRLELKKKAESFVSFRKYGQMFLISDKRMSLKYLEDWKE